MDPKSLAFFKRLAQTPGPSSFELAAARLWRKEAETFAAVRGDVSGNSYATIPGAGPSVMLAGHIDEIGLLVTHIDDQGYLSFDAIGGWDAQVLVGQRVTLLARKGEVHGVIGKKAIHLIEKDDRERVSKIEDLWIDIGASSKADAEQQVRIGDPAVLAHPLLELPNGRLVGRSMDNRIGCFVVLEALRRLAAGGALGCSVTAVASTREEISSVGGGAKTSAVELGAHAAIIVDVTHATDYPGLDKRKFGDYKLGGGPVLSRGAAVSSVLLDLLIETAEAEKIPFALEAVGRDTRTDVEAVFNAHRGVATALVSVPLRYMHSPNEMVVVEDVERTVQLLVAVVKRVKKEMDFVPR
mgnify:CR=1 FL=1